MKKAYQLKQREDVEPQIIVHGERESVRINKYLSAAGVCSRREADRLVAAERVTIEGELAQAGSQVSAGQVVLVDGQSITSRADHVYIALHKPIGITCTLDEGKEGNIGQFMDYHERIFPIGRLDKDSSGLILLTSDGDVVNKILRAEHNHSKEYIVQVNHDVTQAFLKKMAAGVEITNMRTKQREMTKECQVKQLNGCTFSIILTQGLNRQIRRMCTELGYRVTELQRVRIMNIQLGSLQVGQWRYLTQEELTRLNASIGTD